MTTPGETAADVEQRLQDKMPDEILFEIFRRLPKDTLIAVSKLCSKFEDIAGDTRFWKNLHIEYRSYHEDTFDFEDLYSGPWPVKVMDLSGMKIRPPASYNIGQVVQVTTLNLEAIKASEVTVGAILTKYQCTELLGYNMFIGVRPTIFSKQTALEVLSLKQIWYLQNQDVPQFCLRPGIILSNCKNLKTLDLRRTHFSSLDMLHLAKNLPASLEKLNMADSRLEGPFFKFLAKSTPNLRDLELEPTSCMKMKCPDLLTFQFLETLRFELNNGLDQNFYDNMYMYLIKFPALKTVYVNEGNLSVNRQIEFETFRKRFSERKGLQGISVELDHGRGSPSEDDNKDNIWTVRKDRCSAISCWIKNEEYLPMLRRMELMDRLP